MCPSHPHLTKSLLPSLPPQVVNFTSEPGTVGQAWPSVVPPQTGPPPPRPYVFGSTAAGGGFRNDSMPSWGGNVVEGDDELFHLFAAGFVNNCGIGSWEVNSQVKDAFTYVGISMEKGDCPHTHVCRLSFKRRTPDNHHYGGSLRR